MRELNYKLIVSDFDGTLLSDKYDIPESVKVKISEYVEAGGVFAVCTGRMLKSILPQVRALNLKGIVVAYQGTVIADIESGKLLKNGGFSTEKAVEICACLEKIGANINVYSGENLYTNVPADNPYLKQYESITGVNAISVTDMPISEFVKKNKLYCQKTASLVFPNEREELYKKVNAAVGEEFDVTCSAAVLVEVSPKGDDNGAELKYLAD